MTFKKTISSLFLIFLIGCSSSPKNEQAKKISTIKTSDREDEKEFPALQYCRTMIIKSIKCDKSSEYTNTCYGDAYKENNPNNLTFIQMQKGRKVGDSFKYCYVVNKTTGDVIKTYFKYK